MTSAQVVTDLGNLFVASCGTVVVFLYLWIRLNRLAAAVFGVCVGGVVLTTAVLKAISFQTSPPPWLAGPFELSSGAPSGHVVLAMIVYGGAAVVCLIAGRGLAVLLGALLGFSAIVGVAITRVSLGAHTVADVVAGGIVVLPALAVLARAVQVQAAGRRISTRSLLFSLLLVATIALVSGVRISSAQIL